MNVYQYQKQYLQSMFKVTDFEFGYYTSCDDPEFYFGNTIFCNQFSQQVIDSLLNLLVSGVNVCEIQFEKANLSFSDEHSNLYLLQAKDMMEKTNYDIEIQLVTAKNHHQFTKLSNILQIEEYGRLFKENIIKDCLKNKDVQFWMISKNGVPVGEFEYFPQLNTVESIVIAKKYRNQGIGSQLLSLISTQIAQNYYLSADDDSLNFYQKNNFVVLDEKPVSHLYGNLKNLIMFLSLLKIEE